MPNDFSHKSFGEPTLTFTCMVLCLTIMANAESKIVPNLTKSRSNRVIKASLASLIQLRIQRLTEKIVAVSQ